jgi:hydroxymethylpyrimidine pyrophosphatase-like HAD family hydrolase
MPIPNPKPGEKQSDFMQRCMSDEKMKSEYNEEQRAAVCYDSFRTKLAGDKISFDYDGTLSTARGKQRAESLIADGADVYIISARDSKEGMLSTAEKLGIPESRVYATGSNEEKVKKVKELNISVHYDNNPDVIKALEGIGRLF